MHLLTEISQITFLGSITDKSWSHARLCAAMSHALPGVCVTMQT